MAPVSCFRFPASCLLLFGNAGNRPMIDDDDHTPTVTVASYSPPGVAAVRPKLDRGDRVGTRFSVTSRLGGGGSGEPAIFDDD